MLLRAVHLLNVNFIYFSFADMNANQTTITTTPYLPQNVLASGFSGLKLTTQFVNQNFIDCSWLLQSENVLFLNFVACFNVTQNGLQATCMQDNNLITTSLVVFYSLNTTNNPAEFLLRCRTQSSGVGTISSIIIAIRGSVL